MPYGEQSDGNIALGSLELLAETVYRSFMDTATAVSAGGRAPEEVADLVTRVGHGKFDLVIMNPPFARPTNHEGKSADVHIPAFAGFDNTPKVQAKMSARVKRLLGDAPSHGNAGEASYFVEVAHRKARKGGTVAMVLPLSAISGNSWESTRERWCAQYDDIIIVTIAGVGNRESSFSADTGMAECLFIARRADPSNLCKSSDSDNRATFVMLNQQVKSAVVSEMLAVEALRLRDSGSIQRLEGDGGGTPLLVGGDSYGVVINAQLPKAGPWLLAGIADGDLAQVSYHLEHGRLLQVGEPGKAGITLPITRLGDIAERGPVDRDINEQLRDGTPRGPFELVKPAVTPVPTYPMLWAHDAKRERMLVIEPDSEGRIKSASGKVLQSDIRKKLAIFGKLLLAFTTTATCGSTRSR